jgi:hypothetical protein
LRGADDDSVSGAAIRSAELAAIRSAELVRDQVCRTRCDHIARSTTFTVMPDIVGGGAASLAMSIAELTGMPDELPVRYLVVQEGMSEGDVAGVLDRFHGIFVGGAEMSWKVTTAPRWVALAHAAGKLCHIGRIGTPRRLEWAASVGADSVDSNWPLSSTERLVAFGEAARRAGALSRVERYAVAGSRRRRWLSGRGSNWRLPARRRW